MIEWMQILTVILAIGVGFNMGHSLKNNHKILIESYMAENEKLKHEKNYWKENYEILISCIADDDIEDKVIDPRGNVVRVYFKE